MTEFALVEIISRAIARMEGFETVPGCIARRRNNPGNLMDVKTWQIRQFGTLEQGWAALRKQILTNIKRDLTFLEFFAGKKVGKKVIYCGYAPEAAGNHPEFYAMFVVRYVNRFTDCQVTINTVIASLCGGLK